MDRWEWIWLLHDTCIGTCFTSRTQPYLYKICHEMKLTHACIYRPTTNFQTSCQCMTHLLTSQSSGFLEALQHLGFLKVMVCRAVMSHSKLACSYNLQRCNFIFACMLPEIVYQAVHTERQVLKNHIQNLPHWFQREFAHIADHTNPFYHRIQL
jgi:hypothetical protein